MIVFIFVNIDEDCYAIFCHLRDQSTVSILRCIQYGHRIVDAKRCLLDPIVYFQVQVLQKGDKAWKAWDILIATSCLFTR